MADIVDRLRAHAEAIDRATLIPEGPFRPGELRALADLVMAARLIDAKPWRVPFQDQVRAALMDLDRAGTDG